MKRSKELDWTIFDKLPLEDRIILHASAGPNKDFWDNVRQHINSLTKLELALYDIKNNQGEE